MKRPAEAALLDEAQKRLQPRLSVRKAAAAAGISEGWWRQITKGIQSRSTGSIPVVAPAETIARMALAVGVTADELRATGRTDAADVLPAIEKQAESLDLTSISDEDLAAEFLRRMRGARNAIHQTASAGAPDEAARRTQEELLEDEAEVLAATDVHFSREAMGIKDADNGQQKRL